MSSAHLLLERARRDATNGNHARAAAYLQQASAATDDPSLSAQVEVLRAYIEAETGDPRSGISRCRQVLARPGLDASTQGKAWQQLGLLRMRTGEREEALDAFARVVGLTGVDTEDVGYALLNRGNVHLQRGEATAAVADFASARDRLDAAGLEVQRAKAEHNLGYARLLTGDLIGALQMIDRASLVLSPVSAVNRATVEQDRAEILTAAGRPREAIRSLERAAAAYGTRRLRTSQAECELTLSWTVLREDPARARVIARRAARRFRGQASPSRALLADGAALVAEISAGVRTPSVLVRSDALVTELRAHGHTRDATLLQLQAVRVCVARGEVSEAAVRLERVRLDVDAPVPTRLLAQEVRAELAEARGDRAQAHEDVRDGLADLHAWQSSFGSLDLQSTLVGHGRELAATGLRLAVEDGDPELVLEWSERARALVGRVAPVRPPADPQLAADLTELRVLQDAADPARAESLRERVRRRQWYAAGAGRTGEPAGLEQLRAALSDDAAALVTHVVVAERLHALVVTPGDALVLDLGPVAPLRSRLDGLLADLSLAAGHRDDPLAAPLRASLRARLAQVADVVVAPLLSAVGDRRVVLTPSGALAGTPWSLLPGLVGRPLTIPPSSTRWLELRGAPSPTRVGLVAGPGVPRAEEEVRRSATAWPRATTLVGSQATATEVAALAGEVDVLHVAGHGRHTRENPLFSAVELADGPWFGYDIDQLARTPQTVVLSACELGRVSVRSGEEAIGMSAAWLHAGARTVLSSPVLVADDVACEAMSRWHALVAGGRPAADALAEVAAAADDVLPVLTFGAGW